MSNQDEFSGNSESQLIENSAKKKSKIETEYEEIDRISKLPHDLIVEILSLLPITNAYDDGLSYVPKIDKWLEFAVNKKVEDLCMNICLPEVLCSSSLILKLNCENCRILEDCVLNWTFLKSLTLEDLFLRDEHIKKIMSNCPQLESLKLHEFCGFNRDTYCFEIVAPYVEHLMISGVFDDTRIKLREFSSLKHANLDLYYDENTVEDVLVSVCCANELILSSWLIKVISNLMLEEEDISLPLLECRWLTISSYISKLSSPLLDNLIKSTPTLENLVIFPDMMYEDKDIDLLEDKKYHSFEENIVKVSLHNLKNFKAMPLCGGMLTSDVTKLDQF
ncbi:hypothetical protein H5410_021179 [Solanum commersonii]|uniref:Uncharacterized protein n=1 Tax=Solanum commersonii TaxID=4109 RepID=A0A9J5ZB77_SOLCO|nr:hypothetical protein H5410_021179 [Solanum commersonii]